MGLIDRVFDKIEEAIDAVAVVASGDRKGMAALGKKRVREIRRSGKKRK